MRIGFLFNHDQIHQVAHSLPIALALAGSGFAGEIVVATTNAALAAEVRRIGGAHIGTSIEHVELQPSLLSRRMDAMLGRVVPAGKLLIYRDNLAFFRSFDVLVVAEKTSLILKTRYGLSNLGIVHTRHGAGDRAIGFNKASACFDHVLCSGRKIRDRLISEAGLAPDAVTIVGYPKFDLVRETGRIRFLPTAARVVLYNPHSSPHLSSWYRHGHEVFEQFLGRSDHGLLFAPHVMLFQRQFVVTIDRLTVDKAGEIPARFLRGDNIKVDLGSRASTDMSYTLSADIYLGDASSQVYEFLLRPRPCIFLNSQGHDWQGDPNFQHWAAGEVIARPDQLPLALDRADELHAKRYRAVQQDLFEQSFDLDETPSSIRAASAVASFAERYRRTNRHLKLVPA
ncbi:hypothetical protein [Novosphingobium sp. P6W]|uniref:hypothetical protein n=1 Tax=Novosphingobium sp. P6W TaxID=1609758 RepID=UPI0005C3233E|nr:hypothetical protein [Novosphingobium sp. P6W]AXB76559.1 hypothetical protein TQ38_008640 [Novosphingobium sp. P6W]KIS30805.1 hypothetical protein TQ38_20600 [Novosphingobium sp. P6W]